jgi:hypothetical protein
VEEAEMEKGVRHGAAKAVGVEMQEGQVRETGGQVSGEVTGKIGMVEVNAGYDKERRIGGGGGAEDAEVGADIGAEPVGSEVVGVGENGGVLPGLESDVGGSETGAGEGPGGRGVEGDGGGGEVAFLRKCEVRLEEQSR